MCVCVKRESAREKKRERERENYLKLARSSVMCVYVCVKREERERERARARERENYLKNSKSFHFPPQSLGKK